MILEREELCRAVFAAAPIDEEPQKEFIAAFDQATFGHEEKSLFRSFDRFVENHHLAWLARLPKSASGAEPAAIWQKLPWFLASIPADIAASTRDLDAGTRTQPAAIAAAVEAFGHRGNALAEPRPGRHAGKQFEYFRKNILPALDALRADGPAW